MLKEAEYRAGTGRDPCRLRRTAKRLGFHSRLTSPGPGQSVSISSSLSSPMEDDDFEAPRPSLLKIPSQPPPPSPSKLKVVTCIETVMEKPVRKRRA